MTAAEELRHREVENLHVVVRPGQPARTPLLLMNGIGARCEALQPFVDALHPAIPVIRFDAPGVGQSPRRAVRTGFGHSPPAWPGCWTSWDTSG